MDLTKTGKLISDLRKEKGLTQKDVAERLGVCPKTVSKWETGHGFPDISLVSELSKIFQVDISKLLSGEMPKIKPEVGNVKRTKFYVCEKCGNILQSMGDAEIICCGRTLSALKAKEADEAHRLNIEKTEDDYYITFNHPMAKEHYISFVAYLTSDRVQFVTFYPEGNAETRLNIRGSGFLYIYCNKHGLMKQKI